MDLTSKNKAAYMQSATLQAHYRKLKWRMKLGKPVFSLLLSPPPPPKITHFSAFLALRAFGSSIKDSSFRLLEWNSGIMPVPLTNPLKLSKKLNKE